VVRFSLQRTSHFLIPRMAPCNRSLSATPKRFPTPSICRTHNTANKEFRTLRDHSHNNRDFLLHNIHGSLNNNSHSRDCPKPITCPNNDFLSNNSSPSENSLNKQDSTLTNNNYHSNNNERDLTFTNNCPNRDFQTLNSSLCSVPFLILRDSSQWKCFKHKTHSDRTCFSFPNNKCKDKAVAKDKPSLTHSYNNSKSLSDVHCHKLNKHNSHYNNSRCLADGYNKQLRISKKCKQQLYTTHRVSVGWPWPSVDGHWSLNVFLFTIVCTFFSWVEVSTSVRLHRSMLRPLLEG